MKALVTFFLLLLSGFLFSQKLSFDIFLFGNVIGQSVIERHALPDTVSYKLHSYSEAHIFFTYRKNALDYDIVYAHNKLVSSVSKNVRNDESHLVSVKNQSGAYLVVRDGESVCFKPDITYSTVMMFYDEPQNRQQVFSERLGEYRPLKKISAGEYEVDMKDGITYIYRYKNAKLIELEMKKGLLGSAFLRPHN